MPEALRLALAIAGKDIRAELRSRTALLSATVFAALVLVVFNFARDPTALSATDLALNYSFSVNGPFNKSYEIFFEPEILNVFNYKGLIAVNTTSVSDFTTAPFRCPTTSPNCTPGQKNPNGTYVGSGFVPFNPFTTTPVAGPSGSGANYTTGAAFGRPRSPLDYQTPRTFRFSVGIRF